MIIRVYGQDEGVVSMAIDVYINFNGNCREAVEFYSEAFQTEKPQIMTYGEAPPSPEFALPEEAKDLVIHTRLMIEGSRIMFSELSQVCLLLQEITLVLRWLV